MVNAPPATGQRSEPEIKVVMLQMLVNNFFGGRVSYEELRDRFVPALVLLIDHMVSDTVAPISQALYRMVTGRNANLKQKQADFEALTDIALSGRAAGLGLWAQFKSDAPDDALRSNIRVFLAGATEATIRPGSTEPESKDANELLADRAATFFCDPPAPILQIAFASHPDEITADKRFPIHAIGTIDQELVLPGQSLRTMTLAGEDIDRLEIGILATIRWRNNDARMLPVREVTVKCVPLLHRSTS